MVDSLSIKNFENNDLNQDLKQLLQRDSIIESFENQLAIVIHLTDRSKLLKYEILQQLRSKVSFYGIFNLMENGEVAKFEKEAMVKQMATSQK